MDVEIARELADWLAHIRDWNERSVAARDPVFREHIANLRKWEQEVRQLIPEDMPKVHNVAHCS